MAKKIVGNSKNLQIDFAKNFFNLSENILLSKIKSKPRIVTSKSIAIHFKYLAIPKTNSEVKFSVPIPSSHISKTSVQAQLIANFRTKSMLGACSCTTRVSCGCMFSNPKDTIIFYAHGGGFISLTSKSHLDYLHQWSTKLDIPIISVDYSTAPEAPYPRALEEVFYVYCWMLGNFSSLGTSGKKIIVAGQHCLLFIVNRVIVSLLGDSAGGNLVTSLTLKLISNDIRIPDAVVLSYAALLIQFYPSPSRLLSLMDPVLMYGIMLRCLNAYQDQNYLRTCPRSIKQELKAIKSVDDVFLSPLLAGKSIFQRQ